MIKVLIDNGHGQNTLGKCSPDRRLMEWKWTREIARKVVDGLKKQGIDAQLLVPENHDVSLNERVVRVNRWCVERGAKSVVLVSIHNNACPPNDNQWHNASYWSVWIYRQEIVRAGKLVQVKLASKESRELAEMFTKGARANGWKVGVCDGDYKEANFQILRETLCPAVLTENFFQDNRKDVDFLLSDSGKEAIVKLHIDTIKEYISKR